MSKALPFLCCCVLAILSIEAGSADAYWTCVVPRVYTGYFFQNDGAEYTLSTPDSPNSLIEDRHVYDLHGVWLETLIPLRLGGRWGMAIGAAYLFPMDVTSNEILAGAPFGRLERTVPVHTQWWNMDTSLTFDLSPALTGIVGVRYDSFSTEFTEPSVLDAGGVPRFPRGDYAMNLCIPYLGLSATRFLTQTGLMARLGVIGFPVVLGSTNFIQAGEVQVLGVTVPGLLGHSGLRNGFFLEGVAEAVLPFRNGLQLGAFVKFSTVQAQASTNVGERNANIPDLEYDLDFKRKSWIFGGSASFRF